MLPLLRSRCQQATTTSLPGREESTRRRPRHLPNCTHALQYGACQASPRYTSEATDPGVAAGYTAHFINGPIGRIIVDEIASQEIQSSARATRSTRTVMFSHSFRVGITIATLGTAGTAGLRSTEGRPSSRSIWGRTTPIPCGSGSRKMSCPPQQPLRNLRGQTSQKLAGIVIARCSLV